MSELKQTWLQLAPAKGEDPGRVANVFYKIESGKVVMYDAKGAPFVDADGGRYEHKLGAEDLPEQVAIRLAGIINRKFSDAPSGFSGPIQYPKGAFV